MSTPAGDAEQREPAAVPTEADVADLRERLDEIRRLIDDTGVPAAAPVPARPARPARPVGKATRPPRRGRWAALTVLLLAAAVVAAVALGTGLAPGRSGPAPAPRPAAVAAGSTWPGTDRDVPAALVPTGPGVDAPGADVVVAPAVDGRTLEVYERVVPTAPDARWLALTRPVADRLAGVTLPTDVVVDDLRVTVDGSAADVRTVPGGWVVFAPDGQALGPVVLRYRVVGGVTSTSDAPQGRRLLLVWPLTAEASRGGTAQVVVRPDRSQVVVRQMLCPLATPQEQLCGAADDQGWTGRIPAGTGGPLMVVQVDPVTG